MMLIRNIFAVIIGLVVGGSLNMALIVLGMHLILPPAGVDVSDAQSISAHINQFEPRHFLFPLLAHSFGTLAGAATASCIAASQRKLFGYVIGVVFLAGGIMAASSIPAPMWFIVTDLLVAYLPMAFVGTILGHYIKKK